MNTFASKRENSLTSIRDAVLCVMGLMVVTLIIGCIISLYRNEAFMLAVTQALRFENIIYPTLAAYLVSVFIFLSINSKTGYLSAKWRERIVFITEVVMLVLVAFYIALTSHHNAGGIMTVISNLTSFQAAAHITNSFISILFSIRLLVNIYCAFSRWSVGR